MRKKETHPFNRNFATKRINELALKFSWIAESISVNEKTISRWINGQVSLVQKANIEKLATVLECQPEELIDQSSIESYGSPSDQIVAAKLVDEESLMNDLYPIGKLKLLGSIIQSTLQPNVPKVLYARLLSQLAIIHWTQRNFEKGEQCGLKALKIAKEKKQDDIITSTDQWLALIYLFQGRIECAENLLVRSIGKLEDTVSMESAHAYHTYALLKYFLGEFDEGVLLTQQSLDVGFQMPDGIQKQVVLSTAFSTLGNLKFNLNELEEAKSACTQSLEIANESQYDRQIHISRAFLARVIAREGNLELARQITDKCISQFQQSDTLYPSILTIGASVARLDGALDMAWSYTEKALTQSQNIPFVNAAVMAEQALIQKQLGNVEMSLERHEQALSFFNERDVPHWVKYIKAEYE